MHLETYGDDGYYTTLQRSVFWQSNTALDTLPPCIYNELLLLPSYFS